LPWLLRLIIWASLKNELQFIRLSSEAKRPHLPQSQEACWLVQNQDSFGIARPMATIVICTHNVLGASEWGGHMWVYLQYIESLRRLGCEVYWMEDLDSETESRKDANSVSHLARKLESFGLSDKLIIFRRVEQPRGGPPEIQFLSTNRERAARICAQAELLLNFCYGLGPELLSRFRRTALIDIDPALLQFWMSTGQIAVHPHDFYFTTGETVGTGDGLIPDCGLPWRRIRPPICLERWPYAKGACSEAFTTVSNWAGYDWLLEDGVLWENTKRVAFLAFKDLPRHTPQPLELALWILDDQERHLMEDHGWRIQNSAEVAGTPELYQRYIQQSRGEFSCAKASCMKWQNAWVSDRTLCYLASGRPVVVQDTGPSAILPNGLGMFRFSTIEQAVQALAAVNEDYPRHRRAARELAETHFDGRRILARLLDEALSPNGPVEDKMR
jgi:hypothetical protein